MLSEEDEKRWKKIREGIDRTNQKELDIINDRNANPAVRDCLALGVGLTDLTGEQIKKIKPRNRK
jgi:hypothetical protein